MQNQVLLNAGETIQAKLKFKQWLWETAQAKVQHYHSDNGVFTAEMFKEDCADKQQAKRFIRVGAKHQNAEAERAIQTVMYMAREFTIHVAIHWTEHGTDNLSLRSLAVDHSA